MFNESKGTAFDIGKDFAWVVSNNKKVKEKMIYKYCKNEGHLIENYFELVGYLKWYKEKRIMKGNKRVSTKSVANVEKMRFYSNSPLVVLQIIMAQ